MGQIATVITEGIPEIPPAQLQTLIAGGGGVKSQNRQSPVRLIDVRNPDEFVGELGHIENSELVTLGPDLQQFLEQLLEQGGREQAIVFVCRSGARSAHATGYAIDIGYKNVANLQGGMIRWNAENLAIVR